MAIGGFYAPKATQHTLRMREDHVQIRPSLWKVGLIRLVLLGMGGAMVYFPVKVLFFEPFVATNLLLLLLLIPGPVAVMAAFLPWRNLKARIDASGIQVAGRGVPRTGHIGWGQVQAVVRSQRERESGGDTPSRSVEYPVGLQLEDGVVLGLFSSSSERRSTRLVDRLVTLSEMTRGERVPVTDRVSSTGTAGDDAEDVIAEPVVFRAHATVAVDEHREGFAVGPRAAPRGAVQRYAVVGAVALGVVGLIAAVVVTVYGPRFPSSFAEFGALFLAVLGSNIAWKFLKAAWDLRGAPHRYLVTEREILEMDRHGSVVARLDLADVQGLYGAGGTLVADLGGDAYHKLHFEGVEDPADLFWALRALEYVMQERGWRPRRDRQGWTDFEREFYLRFRVRMGRWSLQ